MNAPRDVSYDDHTALLLVLVLRHVAQSHGMAEVPRLPST
jgi:hypothetical protein